MNYEKIKLLNKQIDLMGELPTRTSSVQKTYPKRNDCDKVVQEQVVVKVTHNKKILCLNKQQFNRK